MLLPHPIVILVGRAADFDFRMRAAILAVILAILASSNLATHLVRYLARHLAQIGQNPYRCSHPTVILLPARENEWETSPSHCHPTVPGLELRKNKTFPNACFPGKVPLGW